MPTKGEGYDPMRVLYEAAKSREYDERSVQKARELGFKFRMECAIPAATTPVLMRAGKFLRRHEGPFWFDYVGCELACKKRVSDLGLLPISDPSRFATDVVACKLWIRAVAGDESAVEKQLGLLRAGQLELIAGALSDLRDRVEPWWFGRSEPPTPWITAAELRQACAGKMKGFSRSNISKGMSGQLVEEKSLAAKKEAYCLYRHATAHREMLSHVVEELKKRKDFGFIFGA
jgi:hypothetical protein